MSKTNLSVGTKGAIAELRVSVYLMRKGYEIYRAHSNYCKFDIYAYHPEKYQSLRIEVRTGQTHKGSIYFGRTKHEAHFDIYAILIAEKIIFYDLELNTIDL